MSGWKRWSSGVTARRPDHSGPVWHDAPTSGKKTKQGLERLQAALDRLEVQAAFRLHLFRRGEGGRCPSPTAQTSGQRVVGAGAEPADQKTAQQPDRRTGQNVGGVVDAHIDPAEDDQYGQCQGGNANGIPPLFPCSTSGCPPLRKEEQAWPDGKEWSAGQGHQHDQLIQLGVGPGPGHQFFSSILLNRKTDQQGETRASTPYFRVLGMAVRTTPSAIQISPVLPSVLDDNHRAVQQGCAQMRLNPEQCACVH